MDFFLWHAVLFAQRVTMKALLREMKRERPGLEEKEEGRAFGENSFVFVLVRTALLFLWKQGSSDSAILM
jgi:hypothetical protein